jgi:hypothetical protein
LITKKNNWRVLLNEFFVQNKSRSFEWGKWDCCKFTNAAVVAMTGDDLIPEELKWTDEKSAMQAIKKYGKTLGLSVQKAANAAGLQMVRPDEVALGDVVVIKDNGGQVAGVCDGHSIVCPTDGGYTHKPIVQAHKVFRING